MNSIIAKELGWTNISFDWINDENHGKSWFGDVPKHYPNQDIWPRQKIRNYEYDANSRTEMLSSLTWEEKASICRIAINEIEPRETSLIINSDLVFILELDQPTFAKLFCKVKRLL
jgi:hypothetical protein